MDPGKIGDSYDFVKRILLSARPGEKEWLVVPMFTERPSHEQLTSYTQILGVPLIGADYKMLLPVGVGRQESTGGEALRNV